MDGGDLTAHGSNRGSTTSSVVWYLVGTGYASLGEQASWWPLQNPAEAGLWPLAHGLQSTSHSPVCNLPLTTVASLAGDNLRVWRRINDTT